MYIDFHTHFGTAFSKISIEEFVCELKKAKIARAQVMQGYSFNPKKLGKANSLLAKDIEPYKEFFLPFAHLSPATKNAEETLEDLVKKHNFLGIKFIPVFDEHGKDYDTYYKRLHPLIEKAEKLKIPVMIHTGWFPVAKLEYVGELAETFPKTTFISAHMREDGINQRFSHIHLAKKHDNVLLETSYIPHPKRVAQAVELLGAERLLYGSDYRGGGEVASWEITKVTYARISQEDKRKILYENAKRLLGI